MDAIEAGETILRCIEVINEIYEDNGEKRCEVDREISDILHFIEYTPMDIQKGYQYAKQLQDARRVRREIKDSCVYTAMLHEFINLGTSKVFKNGLINNVAAAKKRKAQLETRVYTPKSKKYQIKEEPNNE